MSGKNSEEKSDKNQQNSDSEDGSSSKSVEKKIEENEETVNKEQQQLPYEELNDYHKLIYPWQQHYDENWSKYFYYNPFTGESVWELPQEIQNSVNIYFTSKRAKAEEASKNNLQKFVDVRAKEKEIQETKDPNWGEWNTRPARKQLDKALSDKYAYRQGDEVYNIWYDKFLSDDKFKEREQAITRCSPDEDSGYTKADLYGKGQSYFCMHFSKGQCCEGQNCNYCHHIATLDECLNIDQVRDIFGRTRFSKHREDMEGVGSFMKETRTLRISDFCMATMVDDPITVTYEVIWRHFSMWGELEDLKQVPTKCVAFIKYTHRCMAEFAKEAMRDQPLDNGEIITVKWAQNDILDSDEEGDKDLTEKNKTTELKKYDDRNKKHGKGKGKNGVLDDDMTLGKKQLENDVDDLNMDGEYSIIQQRLTQVNKNVNVMNNVFKKINTGVREDLGGAGEDGGNEGGNDFDSFFKSYKREDYSGPQNNDRPLF